MWFGGTLLHPLAQIVPVSARPIIVGVDFESLLVILHCMKLPHIFISNVPTGVGKSIVGVQSNRPVIVGYGLLVLFEVTVRNAPIAVGNGIVEVQSNRPVKVGYGPLVLIELPERFITKFS